MPGLLGVPLADTCFFADIGIESSRSEIEVEYESRGGPWRYALGASLQPWDAFAFLLDVIGSSSFDDDEFTIPRTTSIRQLFGNDDLIRRPLGRDTVTAFVPRSDVVDLAVGMKANPWGTLVAFAEVIVPLTRDGLRAEVIPTAGLEWSF